MSSSILVTGGTGTLGRQVVSRLREAGRDVRVMSRHPRAAADGIEYVTGDLTTGGGVPDALDGVATVVHCAGTNKGDGDKARTLSHAASAKGVEHLVYISVVGAERVPVSTGVDRAMFGYFASKRDGEIAIETSGVPWTTLRATQFYELVLMVVKAMAKMPAIPVPSGMRAQPVDSGEVAARLVELALDKPAGLVPDIAGPRVYGMDELLLSYLHAIHRNRALIPMPLPGNAARAVRNGAILAPDRAVGHRTWEEFLAAQPLG
jgi:uncharacterized protein YbjT (DUF2867 family)